MIEQAVSSLRRATSSARGRGGRPHPGGGRQRDQPRHALAPAGAPGLHRRSRAENGREALELLRAEPFDLVLLDILMPEMNGYQVLEQLKRDPPCATSR